MQRSESWTCGYCNTSWSTEASCAECERKCQDQQKIADYKHREFMARRDASFAKALEIGKDSKAIALLLTYGFKEEAALIAKELSWECEDMGSGFIADGLIAKILEGAGCTSEPSAPDEKGASHESA